MFFFSFFSPWIPGSLGRIVIFVFFHLLLSPVTVLVGLTTDAPANRRPPPKEKKRINLVVNLNRRYRLYIWQWLRWTAKTCLTIRFLIAGKVCRHFFFLLFFFYRTALGIVLFCFCCHYRPVMASWWGASSILFMTPGLRLSSVFWMSVYLCALSSISWLRRRRMMSWSGAELSRYDGTQKERGRLYRGRLGWKTPGDDVLQLRWISVYLFIYRASRKRRENVRVPLITKRIFFLPRWSI